jgi:PAS domain-containing protein
MLQFSDLLLILTGIFLALSGAFLLFFQHFPASLTGPSALLRPGTEKGKGIDKNSELKALRLMHDKAPHPVWQINSDGETAWQNPVYEQIVADHPGARKIFRNAAGTPGTHRVCLEKTDKTAPDWYEITVASDNDRKLCHAVCISAQVEAEEKRRNMVQTLAKTFAHLSTGLAIFDNSGRLSLFNPALLELTRLSPAFLSTGPQIGSFFDAIRENRHMPEPRDYQDWRQKIAQMVQEAANGSFHETWTLENGRTYSVFGRPHPEGATAFLIEDISAEVTSTRKLPHRNGT